MCIVAQQHSVVMPGRETDLAPGFVRRVGIQNDPKPQGFEDQKRTCTRLQVMTVPGLVPARHQALPLVALASTKCMFRPCADQTCTPLGRAVDHASSQCKASGRQAQTSDLAQVCRAGTARAWHPSQRSADCGCGEHLRERTGRPRWGSRMPRLHMPVLASVS